MESYRIVESLGKEKESSKDNVTAHASSRARSQVTFNDDRQESDDEQDKQWNNDEDGGEDEDNDVSQQQLLNSLSSPSAIQLSQENHRASTTDNEKHTSEQQDDLESLLDTRETSSVFDGTGKLAYERACKKFATLASSSVVRQLSDPKSKSLDISYYNIGPSGAKALIVPMLVNTQITLLNLRGNGLGPLGMEYIVKLMSENLTITDLNLADNMLGLKGAQKVKEMLVDHQYLTCIDLSGNDFSDEEAEVIVSGLLTNHVLKHLILTHNRFGPESGKSFKSLLVENATLYELDLSWNEIRGKGAIDIAEGVKDNQTLRILNLSWNGFGDLGAVIMSKAFATCRLILLDLSSNRIGGAGFLALLTGSVHCEDLKTLKLRGNPIDEKSALGGLEFLQKEAAVHLELLDLSDNIYKDTITKKTEEVTAIHAQFRCAHGYSHSYGKRQLRHFGVVEMAMKAMAVYCEQHNINIVDLFSRFDSDGSMSVSHEEFKLGLKEAKVPVTDEQIDELIKTLDQDGDGEIDYSEMILGAEKYKEH